MNHGFDLSFLIVITGTCLLTSSVNLFLKLSQFSSTLCRLKDGNKVLSKMFLAQH